MAATYLDRKALNQIVEDEFNQYKASESYIEFKSNSELEDWEKRNIAIGALYGRIKNKMNTKEMSETLKDKNKTANLMNDLYRDVTDYQISLYHFSRTDDPEVLSDCCLSAFFGSLSDDDIAIFEAIEDLFKSDKKEANKKDTSPKDLVNGSVWFLKIVEQMTDEQNQLLATMELVADSLQSIVVDSNPRLAQERINQVCCMLKLLIHARRIALDSDEDACMTYENNHLQKAKDKFGYNDPFAEQ